MAVMVPTVPVTMAMPTVVPPMVPAMMPMMMPMPTHLGGRQLRILLHRCSSARIDQRHRLRTSDRSCHDEKRADSRQAQNFRSVHINLLKIFGYSLCAVSPISAATHSNAKASDVNVD